MVCYLLYSFGTEGLFSGPMGGEGGGSDTERLILLFLKVGVV